MARIKNVEQPETEAVVEVIVEKEEDMSDNVKEVLKAFPKLEKAYVNEMNGVYTVDTAKHIRGNAVLYKNPYFKK